MLSVGGFGDLHFPWVNRRLLRHALAILRRRKPKVVVQIGDLHDFFAFARWPRSLNVMTPRQELKLAFKMATQFWAEVRSACGRNVECFQLKGNHDERLAKRVLSAMAEAEDIVHGFNPWKFDGVQTQETERQELIIDGICYMHGFRKHGEHVKYNLMSTVVGHSHLGGVVFHRQRGKTLFELNLGFLGDRAAAPLSYTQQQKFSRWTEGMGFIDDDGPRFIPL